MPAEAIIAVERSGRSASAIDFAPTDGEADLSSAVAICRRQ